MAEEIRNAGAYEDGKKAHIINNARLTWLKGDPDNRAKIEDLVFRNHFRDMPNEFLEAMYQVLYNKYGKLTEKQEAACMKFVTKNEEWAAEREAKHDEAIARSNHVGNVGDKKVEFTVTLNKSLGFDTAYGWMSILIMEDDNGNVIVYKGSSPHNITGDIVGTRDEDGNYKEVNTLIEEGDKVSFTATIKEHGEYNGQKQTTVLRPKRII